MFVYPRFPLVLKHQVKEQPGRTMSKNAKDIELHPKNGSSNPSPMVPKSNQQTIKRI